MRYQEKLVEITALAASGDYFFRDRDILPKIINNLSEIDS